MVYRWWWKWCSLVMVLFVLFFLVRVLVVVWVLVYLWCSGLIIVGSISCFM